MPDPQDSHQIDDELLDQILMQLIPEAREIIDHLNLCLIQLAEDIQDEVLIETVKRGFHTLKGSSGFAGLDQLSAIAKVFEMLMADVIKGDAHLSTATINLLYEGLDVITAIIDKAEVKDFSHIDVEFLIDQVAILKSGQALEPNADTCGRKADHDQSSEELLSIYRAGYNQLKAIKHMMFSSIHVSDPETLVVLLSQQIREYMASDQNSFWLVDPDEKLIEVARDGNLVAVNERRVLNSDYSEVFQRVITRAVHVLADG